MNRPGRDGPGLTGVPARGADPETARPGSLCGTGGTPSRVRTGLEGLRVASREALVARPAQLPTAARVTLGRRARRERVLRTRIVACAHGPRYPKGLHPSRRALRQTLAVRRVLCAAARSAGPTRTDPPPPPLCGGLAPPHRCRPGPARPDLGRGPRPLQDTQHRGDGCRGPDPDLRTRREAGLTRRDPVRPPWCSLASV